MTALDLLKTLYIKGEKNDACTVVPHGSSGIGAGNRNLFCLLLPCRLSVKIDQKERDGDCLRPDDSGHSPER
jgi:hypothetical protein